MSGDVPAFLASLNRFPRLRLGVFPTPVRQLTLDNGHRFWVKDDSGCSGIYGGNKVRKLEYLLAGARHQGKETLIVHGDVESHTVQACGLLGRREGFAVHAVVFPYRGQTFAVPELPRLAEAGVRVHRRHSMLSAILHAHWLGWRTGGLVIPLGASTPLATLGHVQAALELRDQVREGMQPEPRRIFLPFATGLGSRPAHRPRSGRHAHPDCRRTHRTRPHCQSPKPGALGAAYPDSARTRTR
ncbi:MAG: pyridoxal-phosphate dependent enzyme [Opitutaceae bacterium]|nr:pyridoxal-phosphate dependent enzyme [Opitutaceae bacterium]